MRRYTPDQVPNTSNEKLQTKRPYHLVRGMAVITEYAQVEAHVALLIGSMAQAEPRPFAAIFGVLRQGHIQSKVLLAVAETMLTPEDLGLLCQVLKIAKIASDKRDRLSHLVWMYDDQLPEDVVLVESSLFWNSAHKIRISGGPGKISKKAAEDVIENMRASCELWSQNDLEAARVDSVRAIVGIQAMRLMLEAADVSERQKHRQTVVNVLAQSEAG